MGKTRLIAGLFLASVLAGGSSSEMCSQTASAHAPQLASTNTVPGNEACASCHAQVYNSYVKTRMATTSGPANEGLITGEFTHQQSGVHYRVYQRDGRAWMSYERAGEIGFHGERELLYFLGAGAEARTYLFPEDGFLFAAPINWYSQEKRWNVTPAYAEAHEMTLDLPAFADCLNCHASGMQGPEAGTVSQFAGKPFAHAGITCERCHGAGEGHGEKKSSGNLPGMSPSIVNPAKLPPERRDAICMECHFQGTAAVEQAGKHVYEFQPGERLSDYIHYFVLSGQQPKATALSPVEALSLSDCKAKSGDRMWCGSCHDPHEEPATAERAAYYRSKCLACHGEQFARQHHPEKPDCTACHMPALPSKDVTHAEMTDHRIRQYPNAPPLPQLEVRGVPGAPLVSFPARDAPLDTTRDFALAWETLAERGVEGAPQRAELYVRKAVTERPEDPLLLASLAFVDQQQKHSNEARELYEEALKIDPLENDVAANLGLLEARAGNWRRAVELWQPVFQRMPHRSAIGMDLAMVFCTAGQKDVARELVQRVLEFNPDDGKAKSLLLHLNADPLQCKP